MKLRNALRVTAAAWGAGASALLLTLWAVSSRTDWIVRLDFNQSGEAVLEGVLLPVMLTLSIWLVIDSWKRH